MKKFSIVVSALLLTVLICFGLYKWLSEGIVDLNAIFTGSLALAFLFNALTWGDVNADKSTDELDMHIKTQSAKIGYFTLMVLSIVILIMTEGVGNLNEIKNIPLALVVFFSLAILPITEFFYSKKYR